MLRFPATGQRSVFLPSGAPATLKVGTVYTDAAGTILATIYAADATDTPGAVIVNSRVTTDVWGQLPEWWWAPTADQDYLYITVNGGPLVRIDAGYDQRLDALTDGRNDPARLTFPPRREKVIQLFQSGHGWTLSGTTGTTFADDTADFCLGSQSLRLTTGGAGVAHEIRSPALAAIDLSGQQIVLAIKVDDFTHYSDIQVRVSSNGFTDYGFCKPVYTANTQRWAESGKWQLVTIGRAELVASVTWGNAQWGYVGNKANVDWSAITGMRIRVMDDAAGPMTVRVNLLGYFPLPAKGVLSLVFDDGRRTQYTIARPVMDKYRLNATAAIIARSIGSEGTAYMTLDQVTALQNLSQWSVIAHAYDNVEGTLAHQNGYDGLTLDDGVSDMRAIKNWLNDNGFHGSNVIALPHGSFNTNQPGIPDPNTDVLGTLARFFDAARTTCNNLLETWPPADPYRLRANTATSDDTAANWLSIVDAAAVGKQWAIIQFHHLVTPAVGISEVTPTVFGTFIDGLATRVAAGDILVRSVHEVLQNGFV